jgi:peptidoglycan hydrolase-like protein with peptidoglycan-binding domain
MLSLGSEGDDVIALQKALKYDGFYATGPITGYYGKRTENAVFRFQNYYKEELLIPNGYKVGTGVLGAITRKKINEIILKSGQ